MPHRKYQELDPHGFPGVPMPALPSPDSVARTSAGAR